MATWWQGRVLGVVRYGSRSRGRAIRLVRLLALDGVRRARLRARRTEWDYAATAPTLLFVRRANVVLGVFTIGGLDQATRLARLALGRL
jgi:hypothetical protein